MLLALAVPAPRATAAPSLPTPSHIVIVVEENKPDSGIIGNKSAPYINALANGGANMTQSFAETHPSEPNYLALFSGNTFGLTADACPVNAGAAPNLGAELLAAGYTFAGFSEGLPAVGRRPAAQASTRESMCRGPTSPMCRPRTHCRSRRSTPAPTSPACRRSSFVIPNLDNDMHDGTDRPGATRWLHDNLSHTRTGQWPTTAC